MTKNFKCGRCTRSRAGISQCDAARQTSHITFRLSKPRNAQPPIFAGSEGSSRNPFNRAVDEVSDTARRLLASLHTSAAPRDREIEAEKARERSRVRFG